MARIDNAGVNSRSSSAAMFRPIAYRIDDFKPFKWRPGVKLNLGCGAKPLEGFVNLDKRTGWLWENGLAYPDKSIDAITVSHSLMYVPSGTLLFVFYEMYRVLKAGGVVRITEDATDDPKSERFGGHPETVNLPRENTYLFLLKTVGFQSVHSCAADATHHSDASLLQNFHGGRPKVFFIEGCKGRENT